MDTERFKPRERDRELEQELGLEGKFVILYAGTMGYAHGLETALDAANFLRTEQDIQFLLVGDGSERPFLEQYAAERHLQNVRFIDFQSLEEIPRYYSLSDINLSTLRRYKLSEGVRPSKLFPALASGKPLIYVGEGEGAGIVRESGGGVILEPEAGLLLANTILDLKSKPELCRQMAEKGRAYAVENYSWKTIIEKWQEQFDEVIRGARKKK